MTTNGRWPGSTVLSASGPVAPGWEVVNAPGGARARTATAGNWNQIGKLSNGVVRRLRFVKARH